MLRGRCHGSHAVISDLDLFLQIKAVPERGRHMPQRDPPATRKCRANSNPRVPGQPITIESAGTVRRGGPISLTTVSSPTTRNKGSFTPHAWGLTTPKKTNRRSYSCAFRGTRPGRNKGGSKPSLGGIGVRRDRQSNPGQENLPRDGAKQEKTAPENRRGPTRPGPGSGTLGTGVASARRGYVTKGPLALRRVPAVQLSNFSKKRTEGDAKNMQRALSSFREKPLSDTPTRAPQIEKGVLAPTQP